MLQRDSRPPTFPISAGGAGGGLYFTVAGLLIGLLAAGYVLIGMPGIHSDVASAPDRGVTIQQPAAPADHP